MEYKYLATIHQCVHILLTALPFSLFLLEHLPILQVKGLMCEKNPHNCEQKVLL